MIKTALFFALAVIAITFSHRAEAHLICVLNHSAGAQDVTLLPGEQGDGFTLRAEASGNACVDVGTTWQPFEYSVRDATGADCAGKRIYPSTWLSLEGKANELRCKVNADSRPGLKDYSVRVYLKNVDRDADAFVSENGHHCGYFEWLPITVKHGETGSFPMRIISTGGCWDETTRVGLALKEPLNPYSQLYLESMSGLRCGYGGESAYFTWRCYANSDSFNVTIDRR